MELHRDSSAGVRPYLNPGKMYSGFVVYLCDVTRHTLQCENRSSGSSRAVAHGYRVRDRAGAPAWCGDEVSWRLPGYRRPLSRLRDVVTLPEASLHEEFADPKVVRPSPPGSTVAPRIQKGRMEDT
jgi:hypothetical protein